MPLRVPILSVKHGTCLPFIRWTSHPIFATVAAALAAQPPQHAPPRVSAAPDWDGTRIVQTRDRRVYKKFRAPVNVSKVTPAKEPGSESDEE